MKIYYLEVDNNKKVAIEDQGNFYLLDEIGLRFDDINQVIDSGFDVKSISFNNAKKLNSEFKVLSPIEQPKQDIICVGMNYIDHQKEVEEVSRENFAKEVDTIFFSKRANKILGKGDYIPLNNEITSCLDYEIELGIIISKDAKNIKAKDAKDYIFGFTILNDLSARDLQTKYKQWYYGKSFYGSTVMGPCILLNDGSFDYNNLNLHTYVNGELRQNNNTKNMILGIDEMIEELSKSITLKKGTIIASGTPSGVGMAFDPPKYLKNNDILKLEIDKIGKIENVVKKF